MQGYIRGARYVQEGWSERLGGLDPQRLLKVSIIDKALDKRRRGRSIDDVVKVVSVDNGKIVANKIIIEAISLDFARIHVREGTSLEGISEHHLLQYINIGTRDFGQVFTHHSRDMCRYLRVHHGFSKMNLHCALTVPAQYDLGIRTVSRGLVQ